MTAAQVNNQQGAAGATDEQRAKEERLVSKATAIRTLWSTLAKAFVPPPQLPARNKCHWDFVLQEAGWLAHDVMQERLWRQAAAFQLAYAAATFDRGRLKHIETKVTPSVEVPAEGFGKAQPDKVPATNSKSAKQHAANAAVSANSNHVAGLEDGRLQPDLHAVHAAGAVQPLLVVPPHMSELLLVQLEAADVARLSRHSEARAKYAAAVEEARRSAPVMLSPEEEELLLGKRRARRAKPLLDDEAAAAAAAAGDLLAGSPGAARQRSRPPAGIPAGARPGAELSDVDSMAPVRNDKKKKRARDTFDEDYEPPNKMTSRIPGNARPPLPGGMRPDMQGGVDRKGGMARAGSMKTPPGKGPQAMARQDSGMARMASMPPRGPYAQRQGNAWTPQDDQLLAAFVTEFAQNWYLIADVLKTATSMQGISRRPEACKQHYIYLLRAHHKVPDGEDLKPEQQQPLLNKQQAKEILAASLPVSDAVLNMHRAVLVDVVGKLQQRRMQDRQQTREMHKYRAQEHHSHLASQQKMLAITGHFLTPLEVGVVPLDPSMQPLQQQPGQAALAQPPQQHQPQPPQQQTQAGAMQPPQPGMAQHGMGPPGMQGQGGMPPGMGGAGLQGTPGMPAGPGAGPIGHPGMQGGLSMSMSAADRQRADAQLSDAAAQQAAAQANAAAQAAAAAAVAQQQQGGILPPQGPQQPQQTGQQQPPQIKLPPGMTKEQLLQLAQSAPLATLQQQALAAQAAYQQAQTPQNQLAFHRARAVYHAAQTIHARQQAAAAAAQGGGGQHNGLASRAHQPVTPAQVQQLINSGRVNAQVGQNLMNMAQQGSLTLGHVQQVMAQIKQQAAAAAAAAAAQGGAAPGAAGMGGALGTPGMPPAGAIGGPAIPRQSSGSLGMPPMPMGPTPGMGGWPGAAGPAGGPPMAAGPGAPPPPGMTPHHFMQPQALPRQPSQQ